MPTPQPSTNQDKIPERLPGQVPDESPLHDPNLLHGTPVPATVARELPQLSDDDVPPLLVVVFLRGGADMLSTVFPIAGPDRPLYESARPRLKVAITGDDAALPLDRDMGLNPRGVELKALYDEGYLATILATGMPANTRSHFDAQAMMELGTVGTTVSLTGWMTRHFMTAPNMPDEIMMPSISVGSSQGRPLQGDRSTITMSSLSSFNLNYGPWRWRSAQRVALRNLYYGSTSIHDAGIQSLNAMDIIETAGVGAYEPGDGAEYPENTFGRSMALIAQLCKLRLGLRCATVDLSGWDSHNGQGDAGLGAYGTRMAQLSGGIGAFLQDLGNSPEGIDTTIVVMTEFGRRFRENADRGTDHGHGFHMLVAGRQVMGGVYGPWPGLAPDALYDGIDLAATTDYRQVLSEIIIRRLGNPNIGDIFPGYTGYTPLGFMQGSDIPPVINPTVTPTPKPTQTPGVPYQGPPQYPILTPTFWANPPHKLHLPVISKDQ